MSTVDVLLTCWPIHLSRVEYLAQTVTALKKYLSAAGHEMRWICSCESGHSRAELKARVAQLCAKHGIEHIEHPGASNLGRHMNWLVKKHLRGDYVFYVQEDWLLEEPLDLDNGIRFITGGQTDFLRYYWQMWKLPREVMDRVRSEPKDDFLILPKTFPFKFSHNPYLAARSFYKRVGPWQEIRGQENDMNNRVLALKMPAGATAKSVFSHIGWDSTLGHNTRRPEDTVEKYNLAPFAGHFSESHRMSDPALKHVRKLLVEHQPASIFEIGPGLSSFLFCIYCRYHPAARYVGLDHTSEYNELYAKVVADAGFDPKRVIATELLEDYYDTDAFYSAPGSLKPGQAVELLIVDGPPRSARRGSKRGMAFVLDHINKDTAVLVDDSRRAGEAKLSAAIAARYKARHYNVTKIVDTQYKRQSTLYVPRHWRAVYSK